jgi:hypothetical protein
MGAASYHMETRTKVFLYKTYVRPVLLYGMENIQLTQTEKQKLQRYENIMIKQLFNIKRRTHAKDFIVALGLSPIEHEIANRKVQFYKNMLRNELTKQVADELGSEIDRLKYQEMDDKKRHAAAEKIKKLKRSFIMETMEETKVLTYDETSILNLIQVGQSKEE